MYWVRACVCLFLFCDFLLARTWQDEFTWPVASIPPPPFHHSSLLAVVPDHWVAVGPAKDGLEEAMALGGAALAAGPGAEPLVAAHVTLIAVLSTVFHKRLKSVAPLSYFSPEVPFFGDLLSTYATSAVFKWGKRDGCVMRCWLQ